MTRESVSVYRAAREIDLNGGRSATGVRFKAKRKKNGRGIRRSESLNEIGRGEAQPMSESRPLGAHGRVTTIVAVAAAIGTKMIGQRRGGRGFRLHPGHRLPRGCGAFVAVHAGGGGGGFGKRLSNAVLGNYRVANQRRRSERREQEHQQQPTGDDALGKHALNFCGHPTDWCQHRPCARLSTRPALAKRDCMHVPRRVTTCLEAGKRAVVASEVFAKSPVAA